MTSTASKAGVLPLIGLPACVKEISASPFHTVQEKYLTAVRQAAQCAPLILPALGWVGSPGTELEFAL